VLIRPQRQLPFTGLDRRPSRTTIALMLLVLSPDWSVPPGRFLARWPETQLGGVTAVNTLTTRAGPGLPLASATNNNDRFR